MTKTQRNAGILLVLAVVLVLLVLFVNNNVPDTTGGLRDVTNRDDNYYATQVALTETP